MEAVVIEMTVAARTLPLIATINAQTLPDHAASRRVTNAAEQIVFRTI